MNCVACNKHLEPAIPSGEPQKPSLPVLDGLVFSTSGNYGSTVYDPMNAFERMIIVLCDSCFLRNVVEGNVIKGTRTPEQESLSIVYDLDD